MTTISVNIDETKWQSGLDAANAKRAKNAPEMTLTQFVQTINDTAGDNFANIAAKVHLQIISKASPENLARIAKVLSQPEEIQAQIGATIDGLPQVSTPS